MKAETSSPTEGRDLSGAAQAVGSTGSPLSPEGFDWIYERLGADTWLFSTSGGTDVCTAFVGGVPTLPVYRGRAARRGRSAPTVARLRAREGEDPLIGEVGELVLTRADALDADLLLGRPRGRARGCGRATSTPTPASWRHGDWIVITDRGTAIIYGRSDSTINRGGVRMGTSRDLPRRPGRWRRSPTRWWSTSLARARRTGCRCSSSCARAPSSTTS